MAKKKQKKIQHTIIVEGVWPRIQSSLEKPHWISLDFSHWEYQDEGSEGEEKDEEKERTMDPKKIEEMVRE